MKYSDPHRHIFAMAYFNGRTNGFELSPDFIKKELNPLEWTAKECKAYEDGYQTGVNDSITLAALKKGKSA